MTDSNTAQSGLLARFAGHPVGAHLLMVLMLLLGVFALSRINTQFFPNFDPGLINVSVVWQGASAADMEQGVTRPLEQELRSLDQLDTITSTSAQGHATIRLEFREGTNMGEALEDTKSRVGQVRGLPEDAETPEVTRITQFDPVASVLVYAKATENAPARGGLRQLVQDMRDQLLDRGIAKVEIAGLPEQKIAIRLPPEQLWAQELTLPQVADRVAAQSQDLPAGEVGEGVTTRQLRTDTRRERAVAYEGIPLVSGMGYTRLGDIATIRLEDRDNSVRVSYQGRPAVELALMRSKEGDTLASARTLQRWIEDARIGLPPGVGMRTFDETWSLLKERIMLLVTNGLSGLLLVLGILFLFLRGRVAFWVAVGIPASFMAALALLYSFGGSVNMISLFALIMTLGIIVDDAIVVGEQALTRYQEGGEDNLAAPVGAARRMWPPVLSSSLTTVAAFLPLMLVGGTIGKILFDIPFVVICVILASLVEAFLVLPGHLAHSFRGMVRSTPDRGFRARFDAAFARFRDGPFQRWVRAAVARRGVTLAAGIALLIAVVGLLVGGRLPFSFFPAPEGTIIEANAKFAAGTPRNQVDAFLTQLRTTLRATAAEYPDDSVQVAVAQHGATAGSEQGGGGQTGDQFGSMMVELTSPEARAYATSEFVERWRERVTRPPGLEALTLTVRQGGPPGSDISIRLTGAPAERLKAAAQDLADELRQFPGISAVEDDMPYGREELRFRVTPEGRALGLTEAELGEQLRAAYAGELVDIFTRGEDEIEVRAELTRAVQGDEARLASLPIRAPDGTMVPFESVADLTARRGFEALRHADAELAVHVQAEVDRERTNTNRVLDALGDGALPRIAADYGVAYEFTGRAEDQAETLADMQRGLILGLVLIYLILAAVFASYAWPLVVMGAIPFGLVGALFGHWVMGLDLTVLSLFGLFGLSGIVVNNAIILVSFFRDLRNDGHGMQEALVGASCRRLRPMLLTSLTTIAGLLPLLFEDSLQAQFLIPMAAAIVFGLAFATVLVLLLVPAMLGLQQDVKASLAGSA